MEAGAPDRLVSPGPFRENCWFLASGGDCLVVDPGEDREEVLAFLAERRWTPRGILLTHAHLDHVGAVGFARVPVYLHRAELPTLLDERLSGYREFGIPRPFDPRDLDLVPLDDGATLALGDGFVRLIATPGHTPGGACWLAGPDLFSGDTLFASSVGRCDLPGGDEAALRRSVLSLLDTLPPETRVHPGHGPSTTVGRERSRNPFYLEWKADR